MNRWLQSAQAREAIEARLSEALRMPVRIGSIRFSAWSGLAAGKVVVTHAGETMFETVAISADYRLAPLFRGKVVLSEVRIEQPHLRMIQRADGGWGMPQTATGPASVETPRTPVSEPADRRRAADASIAIGKIRVEDGTLTLIGNTGHPVLTATGLNVTLTDVNETAFNGDFLAGRIVVHGAFGLENVTGLATRRARDFQITAFNAGAGGGSVSGETKWAHGKGSVALKIAGINLALAAESAGPNARRIAGLLGGEMQFNGLGGDPAALEGKGTIALKGGDCSQFEILRQIADALRITSLADFRIADALMEFRIAGGQIHLAPMDIKAPPAGITFAGTVGFDGAVNLGSLLHLPAPLIESQGSMLASRFTPADALNRRSLPFVITGTLSDPKQNLAEALTGSKDRRQQRIIAAETILSSILEKKNPKLLKLLPQLVPGMSQPGVQPPVIQAQP